MYCPGANSRSGGKSLPSAIISGSLNPGTLSKIKGIGLEGVVQPKNKPLYGVVTGTGKIGALVSSSQENSFFGNRSIELPSEIYRRYHESKRYQNNKVTLAGGVGIVNKQNFALDFGAIVRRNSDTQKILPGIGLSGNLWFLTFGYSVYRDDIKLQLNDEYAPEYGTTYADHYNSPTYQETFTAGALTLGTRVDNFFFEYSAIATKYKFYQEDTLIRIFSAAYNRKKWLFNLAFRTEDSPNYKYVDDRVIAERKKKSTYLGIQYSTGRHLLLGVAYNRFLLDDLSASLTLSF